MIFDAIAGFLMGVLEGVLGLFPSYTPDFPSMAGLGTALAGGNSFFPFITLGACLLGLVTLKFFIVGVTFVTWIWDKVPFTFK